ncbi:hypothetical protein COUCH_26165 [Couchioplanes caeruleus]|uniref:hypothetical protein n=1 Tax=Couchioplanes caeruleus TaxID=56438 RepID=UPI0020C10CD4|nr:hypothetical protein [Couchioplanes caeruleus]UQU62506.1 hypothetical protein COUCH_26165 [Couchioplanes caeruleus]
MSTPLIPVTPLIPAVVPASPAAGRRAGSAPVTLRRPPLPLPHAGPCARIGASRYALTAVDKSGRLAARTILSELGWPAGARLEVREHSGLIAVIAAADGNCVVDARGHLVLPLAMRRRCRLAAGQRVLLVADRQAATLTGYPLQVLDRLLGAPAHASAPVDPPMGDRS